jgi:hypothetical protein
MGELIGKGMRGLPPLTIAGESVEEFSLNFSRLHLDKAELQSQRRYEFSDSALSGNFMRELLWASGLLRQRQKPSDTIVAKRTGFVEVIVEKRPDYALLQYLALGYIDERGSRFTLSQGFPLGVHNGGIQSRSPGRIGFTAKTTEVDRSVPLTPELEKSFANVRERIDRTLEMMLDSSSEE